MKPLVIEAVRLRPVGPQQRQSASHRIVLPVDPGDLAPAIPEIEDALSDPVEEGKMDSFRPVFGQDPRDHDPCLVDLPPAPEELCDEPDCQAPAGPHGQDLIEIRDSEHEAHRLIRPLCHEGHLGTQNVLHITGDELELVPIGGREAPMVGERFAVEVSEELQLFRVTGHVDGPNSKRRIALHAVAKSAQPSIGAEVVAVQPPGFEVGQSAVTPALEVSAVVRRLIAHEGLVSQLGALDLDPDVVVDVRIHGSDQLGCAARLRARLGRVEETVDYQRVVGEVREGDHRRRGVLGDGAGVYDADTPRDLAPTHCEEEGRWVSAPEGVSLGVEELTRKPSKPGLPRRMCLRETEGKIDEITSLSPVVGSDLDELDLGFEHPLQGRSGRGRPAVLRPAEAAA